MAVCRGSGSGSAGYSGSSPSVSEDEAGENELVGLDQTVGNGNRIVPNCVAACSGNGAVTDWGSGNGVVVNCGVVVVWCSGNLLTKGPGPESVFSESGSVSSGDMGTEGPSWGNTACAGTGGAW